ncbi:hypothetical protein VV02_23330 [Luteipulveratus mongoliensis]|uniref:CopG family transcriptional regulator n=2 Tax=Luteipulveratus mongoliensis TaxID=571913 RepID=A0A0K1JR91_9MICO|nr:hypothetical protein VV02_23330 [Luteipulveratus mongoliensis]
MNVRLTSEADTVLSAMAEQQGISKNEAINRAILEQGSRSAHREDVRRLARQTAEDYGRLLSRLAR